jgi:hypothetical protein
LFALYAEKVVYFLRRGIGIHERKTTQDATMYKNFIIPYLYEAQHVSGDTPPIIRGLKLHWQPLVFHTCKVAGRVVGGLLLGTVPDVLANILHQGEM